MYSPKSFINPYTNYEFESNFSLAPSPSPERGDVDIIVEKSQFLNHEKVIDFQQVPFRSGYICYIDPSDLTKKHASYRYDKGKYCGRQYELARKIEFINQNRWSGEPALYEDCYLTHDGSAVRRVNGRSIPLDLDIEIIESRYQKTIEREEPVECGEGLGEFALTVSALAVMILCRGGF